MAPKRPFILVALPLILALLLAPGGVAPITADEPQPPPPLQYRTHSAPAAILSNRTTLQQS
ncbi:MAG: hypothetical protein M1136_01135 [Chloroflexi bacterium]|nr:hypothetical protein [Chloroflexota bacterium]